MKTKNLLDEKKWREDLIWCPTQISKDVYIGSLRFELYLRWRWEDPFTFYITFSNDLEKFNKRDEDLERILNIGYFDCKFLSNNLIFIDKEYKKAEKAAEKIWYNIEKPRLEKLLKENPEFMI